MAVNDDLGTRMKMYYELSSKTRLLRRIPVAIRIDGRAFHTFTKHFAKPFDHVLMDAMQQTMLRLCKDIQGCILGYTQSDEITLVLCDFERLNSAAWFDYEVQKLCSVSASMATLYFNKEFTKRYDKWFCDQKTIDLVTESNDLDNAYAEAAKTGAMFDARCFNIPKEEVTNLIYWRQLDATRNSIEMVGHYYFKQSELHKKSCSDIQDMLMEKHNINWNNFEVREKRGSCCIKVPEVVMTADSEDYTHMVWKIDNDIPIFKGEGRDYIEKLIPKGE